MQGDLTTIGRVKDYLGDIKTDTTDTLIGRLVSAVSKTVLNYVGRSTFAVQQFVDVYDGNGKDFLLVRQWPVISVAKIEFAGIVLDTPADTTTFPPKSGYTIEDADTVGGAQQRLMLWGYGFPRGRGNVRVTYTAGYRTLGEAASVPAGTPFKVDPQNVWLSDLGVTYANGTALVQVAANPAAGQYAVAGGQYVFAAADAGAAVLLSYSSVPADVDRAVCAMVGMEYQRRQRLGIVSKSIGGQETVSFSQKDMHDTERLALNPFRRVTPT